jgi:hypothetical protein
MELFENYEQDYANISSTITRRINTELPQASGGKGDQNFSRRCKEKAIKDH